MNKGNPWLYVFGFFKMETEYFYEGFIRKDVNGHLGYNESVGSGYGRCAAEATHVGSRKKN
jgi:hypothetical protein